MLQKRLTVLQTFRQFQKVLKQGYKTVTPAFVLYKVLEAPSEGEVTFGIIASKKVGGAVDRNFCKRRLREVVRDAYKTGLMTEGAYVLVARSALITYAFDALGADFKKALAWKPSNK